MLHQRPKQAAEWVWNCAVKMFLFWNALNCIAAGGKRLCIVVTCSNWDWILVICYTNESGLNAVLPSATGGAKANCVHLYLSSNVAKQQCRCTSPLTSFHLQTTYTRTILIELRWLFQSSDCLTVWPREPEHWALTLSGWTDIASASWHLTQIDEVTVYIRYSCFYL